MISQTNRLEVFICLVNSVRVVVLPWPSGSVFSCKLGKLCPRVVFLTGERSGWICWFRRTCLQVGLVHQKFSTSTTLRKEGVTSGGPSQSCRWRQSTNLGVSIGQRAVPEGSLQAWPNSYLPRTKGGAGKKLYFLGDTVACSERAREGGRERMNIKLPSSKSIKYKNTFNFHFS